MEFTELKACLSTWYERKDPLAARKFVEQFLQPAVRREGQRCRLPADQVDDLNQTVAIFFLSNASLALNAESVGFWRRQITWKIKDHLRRHSVLRKRYVQPEAVEPHEQQADHPAFFEERFVASVFGRRADRAEWLRARLAAMPIGRRVFFLVHHHCELGAFFVEADFQEIERRSGWERASIMALLADDPGDDPNTLLPLLFSTAEIGANRERCLDNFRKGRKRALENLQAAIAEEEA